jgi:hypothetical protein
MHAHSRKVVPETPLHIIPEGRIQRAGGPCQRSVDAGRNCIRRDKAILRDALNLWRGPLYKGIFRACLRRIRRPGPPLVRRYHPECRSSSWFGGATDCFGTGHIPPRYRLCPRTRTCAAISHSGYEATEARLAEKLTCRPMVRWRAWLSSPLISTTGLPHDFPPFSAGRKLAQRVNVMTGKTRAYLPARANSRSFTHELSVMLSRERSYFTRPSRLAALVCQDPLGETRSQADHG